MDAPREENVIICPFCGGVIPKERIAIPLTFHLCMGEGRNTLTVCAVKYLVPRSQAPNVICGSVPPKEGAPSCWIDGCRDC